MPLIENSLILVLHVTSPSGRRDSVTEPGLWTMHRPARAPGRSPARKTRNSGTE